uniref:Uncharacterized protein n=1 Tax=Tanacetum cinerariifolium TaxID=118510 RepID=A0A6L2LNQ5_TANCI|nr:hypothetical protein [Tanacetum cinerariifolium]
MPIILGRSLLATAHVEIDVVKKLISLEVGNEKVVFKIEDNFNEMLTLIESESREEIDYRCSKPDQGEPWEIKTEVDTNFRDLVTHYDDQCDGGDIPDEEEKECYWICMNDDKRLDAAWEGMSFKDWVSVSHVKVCKMTKERILKDYWRQELNNDPGNENEDNPIDVEPNIDLTQEENPFDEEEDCEDLENFRDERMELILDGVEDRIDDDWFTGTINDEDDLDGIVHCLELKSHDDFDEAYKERMCKLLGMTYKKPSPILIEEVEVTRYMISPGESYTKVRILEIE